MTATTQCQAPAAAPCTDCPVGTPCIWTVRSQTDARQTATSERIPAPTEPPTVGAGNPTDRAWLRWAHLARARRLLAT